MTRYQIARSKRMSGRRMRTANARVGRPSGKTTVEIAVADFERSLVERNASAHTIKAYRGDLENFAGYAGSRGWHAIDHMVIREFLSHLYEQGLGKTSVARSLAAVRSLYRWLAQQGVVEQNPAALVSTPEVAEKASARSDHRGDESRARRTDAGGGRVSRTGPADARAALRLRHPQFRTGWHPSRGHPAQLRGHSHSAEKARKNATFPSGTQSRPPWRLIFRSGCKFWRSTAKTALRYSSIGVVAG